MSSEQLPTDAMTVKEAAACWPDSRRDYLKRFGENFGVPLRDLHIGHIRTYQDERAAEVSPLTVELELDALRSLLQELGLGAEIERLPTATTAVESEFAANSGTVGVGASSHFRLAV